MILSYDKKHMSFIYELICFEMSVYKKEDDALRTEVIYRLFLTVWDVFSFICFFIILPFRNKQK